MTIDSPRTADIPALRQLWKQAFGDTDGFLDGFFCTGFSRDRCRCVHLEDQLAAALYWFDCSWQNKKLAYLYAVATDAAFQGKGLCRALMTDTHTHLKNNGYAGAVLVPGDRELFSLYSKLGYRSFCPMQMHRIAPAGTPVILCARTPEQYAAARKQYLPQGGIVQAGATLCFLSTFCRLYACNGGLFCVSTENGTAYFQEYLGDLALLPGILVRLGVTCGCVRLPGGDVPFGMYLPLDGGEELPAYLGIPLN